MAGAFSSAVDDTAGREALPVGEGAVGAGPVGATGSGETGAVPGVVGAVAGIAEGGSTEWGLGETGSA